jgi:hypothetical protein
MPICDRFSSLLKTVSESDLEQVEQQEEAI